jgi:hypothetical protein
MNLYTKSYTRKTMLNTLHTTPHRIPHRIPHSLIFFLTFILLLQISLAQKRVLPFSRIKMTNDDIFFTLGLGPVKEKQWHKLLSIESFGADAIVKFAKEHYGTNLCDYKIECYKFNIIVNFDKVFNSINGKGDMFPKRLGLEFELENKVQNGVDVEATYERFKRNEDNIEVDIKMSRSVENNNNFKHDKINLNNILSKGLNRLKKTFNTFFNDDQGKDTIHNDENLNLNFNNSSSKSNNSDSNLRKEFSQIKNEIHNLEKQEETIQKNILTDIQKINSELDKEKSVLNNIWKTEIIAGMVGAFVVFGLLAFYYICNGLLKSSKIKKTIN